MRDVKDLKIYFVSTDKEIIEELKTVFNDEENIHPVCMDIVYFYEENKKEIDCLVSPGNSFGNMSLGYDAALLEILGFDFDKKVQEYIKNEFYSEQMVGTSFIIETDIKNLYFIHTPTMRNPTIIKNSMVVYNSLRSTLICALKNNIKSIVIPTFGMGTGMMDKEVCAKRMYQAYNQIKNHQNI